MEKTGKEELQHYFISVQKRIKENVVLPHEYITILVKDEYNKSSDELEKYYYSKYPNPDYFVCIMPEIPF